MPLAEVGLIGFFWEQRDANPLSSVRNGYGLGGERAERVFEKVGRLELRLCGFGQIAEASWFLHSQTINEQY